MAGEAKTRQFNLSTGTLMLGPQGEGEDLTPELHSVGLVKDITLNITKTRIELTQGITNEVVDSQVTGNEVNFTANLYEYTSKNLAYAAGIDGSKMKQGKSYPLKDQVVGDGSSTSEISIVSDLDVSSDFQEGQQVMIQATRSGKEDLVYLGRVESSSYTETSGGNFATGTITVATQPEPGDQVRIGTKALVVGTDFQLGVSEDETAANIAKCQIEGIVLSADAAVVTVKSASIGTAGNAITLTTDSPDAFTLSGGTLSGGEDGVSGHLSITLDKPLPVGMSFVVGDVVSNVNFIPAASNEETPYLSAKVVAVLPNGQEPVVIVCQKCRVVNGFNFSTITTDYGSLPFEIVPYALLPEDKGYDRERKSRIYVYKK